MRRRFKYRGFFGYRASRRCPHSNLRPLYGDTIIAAGGYRLWCEDCGRLLDGPVKLAELRKEELSKLHVR